MGSSKQESFVAAGFRVYAVATIVCFALGSLGCASPPAFSKTSPGLAMLQQESSWYYDDADVAIAGAATSARPSLALRVANLFDSYTLELRRAEDAASAWLPRAFSIATVVLPLSGTVGGLVLPSSAATTVSTTAGSATSLLAITSLFYNPNEGLHSAQVCAAFLRNALDSLAQRWNRDELDTIEDTPEQWQIYLAMRSGLDAGRHASCPDPDPPRQWWTPWRDDPPQEPALATDAQFEAPPDPSGSPLEAQVEPAVPDLEHGVDLEAIPIDEPGAGSLPSPSTPPTGVRESIPQSAPAVQEAVQESVEAVEKAAEKAVDGAVQKGADSLPVEVPGPTD